MRRVRVYKTGDLRRLILEDAADPEPRAGEVCIEVDAAGVNFADLVVRLGLYPSARKYGGYPITPGFEVAGTITAVGPGVGRFHTGEQVVGITRFGGYASRVCLPEAQVLPLPKGLSLPEAAGFPVAYLTAWYAVRELFRIRPGRRVLIHSAAGGVGGALVQLCKHYGCYVVGVVGAKHKVELALSLGADVVIDKSSVELWPAVDRAAGDGFHVVLDANGAETLREGYRRLCPTGRLVIYGFHSMLPRGSARVNWLKAAVDWFRTPRFDPFALTDQNRSVLAFNLSYLFDELGIFEEALAEIVPALESGALRALPVTRVPFEDVQEAHRMLHSGTSLGKVVLKL
jgi:NADPH:quinone reductase-like Zn-dependent oxidoreductase